MTDMEEFTPDPTSSNRGAFGGGNSDKAPAGMTHQYVPDAFDDAGQGTPVYARACGPVRIGKESIPWQSMRR